MTTLAELRQANLKEQKPTPPAPVQSEGVSANENAPVEISPAPPVLGTGGAVVVPALHLTQAEGPTEEQQKGGEMLAHIHAGLSKKSQYNSGAKVSIDMPPALFHRAKRYCNAHGNVTLRQVCLELLAAYLDEEGA